MHATTNASTQAMRPRDKIERRTCSGRRQSDESERQSRNQSGAERFARTPEVAAVQTCPALKQQHRKPALARA
eukprot:4737317-Alexandrium_andersonii.AAC.1